MISPALHPKKKNLHEFRIVSWISQPCFPGASLTHRQENLVEQTTLATSLGEETAETKMVSLERSQAELQAAVEAFWSWENLRKLMGTSTINAGLEVKCQPRINKPWFIN